MVKKYTFFLLLIIFSVSSVFAQVKISEDFNVSMTPAGWTNSLNQGTLISRQTAVNSYGRPGTIAAIRANNYGVTSGNRARLESATFASSVAGDSLFIDVAHRAYPAYTDSLIIHVYDGANFVRLIGWGSSQTLDTITGITVGAAQTGGFTPTASQWCRKKLALPLGTTQIRFEFFSNFGNHIWLDNVIVAQPSAPTALTGVRSNLLSTSVTLAANIPGAYPSVDVSGIILSTTPMATLSTPGVIDSTSNPVVSNGSFTKNFAGLIGGTTYYYRAYAINNVGTAYGADSSFITPSGSTVASINRNAPTNVATTTATVGGTIVNNGGDPITVSGVVYSTSSMPAIGGVGVVDSVTTPNAASGSFSFNLSGLTHSTKYYYRAYAINAVGTAYSSQDSFTTAPIVSVIPYTENFDGVSTPWSSSAINFGTNAWERGTPIKTYLNAAFSAPNAFVTKLSGNYLGNEDCVVTSPQFDFSSQTADPVITFVHKFDESSDIDYDGGVLEISINNGTWTRLDNTTGTGPNFNTANSTAWYNNGAVVGTLGANKFNGLSNTYSSHVNGWITSTTQLTGAAGQSDVKVRFRFWADGVVDEGWAIDNIEIKAPVAPTVSTLSKTNITTNGVTLSGNIISNGNAVISASGIVLSTTPAPVRGGVGVIDSSSSPLAVGGSFSLNVSGLANATTYYYRAYAVNGVGTSYGADSSFTTLAAAVAPSVSRNAATNVGTLTATVGGTILNNGGDPITTSGVVFATTATPTIGGIGVIDSVTAPTVTSGSFSFNLAGLTHSTKYYYRAYAINAVGTSYSAQDSFTTAPIVSSLPYNQNFDTIANNTGWSSGVTGAATINAWVLGTPAKTNISAAFSSPNAWVTGLTGNYANGLNAVLTSPQFDFTGQTADPILSFQHKFLTISGVDMAFAEISINGGAWTALDNVYGTGTNFTTPNGSIAWYNGPNNFWTTTGTPGFTGNSNTYASQVNGWVKSTTKLTGAAGQSNVRFRLRFESTTFSFFGTSEGWAVDNIEVYPPVAPTIITGTKSNIAPNAVTLGANIVSNGNAAITASGVVISTAPAPVRGALGVIDSSSNPLATAGSFNVNITGLANATTYYYRGYAVNGIGTSYGADSSFTTLAAAIAPTVLKTAASNVTTTTASVGGNITSNGGDPVTASGVVYSTSSMPVIGGLGVIDSVSTPNVASGSFSFNLGGLTHSTKYYYRAYATNSVGTSYSLQDSFTTSPIVSSFPYNQNFDLVGNTGWTTEALNARYNSWALGTPSKTFINSAYSAPNAYVTNLTTNYGGNGNEESALVSPQFDFSTSTSDPILRFRNKHKTNNDPGWDCGIVEISINNGPWTRLNNVTGTGTNFNTLSSHAWHNLTNTSGYIASGSKFTNTTATYASQVNGWVQSATILSGAAGQSNVKFRFHFAADAAGTDEGWAIDDIEVVQLTQPTIPASSVVLTPNPLGGEMNVSVTAGNGQERMIVARLNSTLAVAPFDSLLYNASSVFGSTNTTGAGNFIVYKGTGTTVNVTGLANFTNYSFDVYEYNGKYMHNKFATAATSSNSTLPVKLITFAGVNKNNDAFINWITASEIENKGFEVERSLDGKSFVNVGFVKGKGNSNSTNRYELTDKGVFAKNTVAYYRLKQIDFNGTYTYSQVIKINAKSTATNSMVVYPNPSVGEFNVSFQSNIEGNGLIEISDIQGKVIYTKNVLVSLGANNFPIEEKANFGKGIYFVKFNMNGEIHVEKLVKN